MKNILSTANIGASVKIQGWVRSRRDSKGGFSFLDISDGSCVAGIQVIADRSLPNYDSEVKHLTTGCSVEIEGNLQKSPGTKQQVEVLAKRINVIGWVDNPTAYPLQKKRHSLEFLREIAHLRARTRTFGAVSRIRNSLSNATHNFFQSRGFLYIHTPIITPSDCEGAGELFRVTAIELDNVPKNSNGEVDFRQDFFGRPVFLTVSGQLYAEAYASALTNVYTFGPTFRADNSNTPRHLAEFWMVEPEMAFCDLEGDMDLAESYVKHLFRSVLEDCTEDIEFLERLTPETKIIEPLTRFIDSEFERISYTEAVKLLEQSHQPFEVPVKWGTNLQSEHERFLCEKYFGKPIFIFNYPKQIKPFYMRVNEDNKTVAAMDLLIPRIGEIIGGSQREERLDVLQERMRELNIDPRDYWWYIDLRRFGSVPHSGFGLGFDRVVQFVSGMRNIRDVIPFPRTPNSAEL
ncbi:asparagine--tRNA ligase [Candidatus Sumerlaeota bacterium]|nr:asparagine--tRNA ligase [Candidatus Sumerlaeota bacterium]